MKIRICMVLTLIATSFTIMNATAADCSSVSVGKCSQKLSTGITMKYVETGPKSGPNVILLHGLTDSVRSWNLGMKELAKVNPKLHIYALDQRGHGDTSLPTGPTCKSNPASCYELNLMAADVIAFMDSKNIKTAIVAGHSMGSLVTQELALRYPTRISKAVLIATTPKLKGNTVASGWLLDTVINGTWGVAFTKKGIKWPEGAALMTPLEVDPKAVEWMAANWDVDAFAPTDHVSQISKETAKVKMQTWVGATTALTHQDNIARLKDLKVPTLVLWGTQDSFFYKSEQDLLLKSLKVASGNGLKYCWKQYGTRPLDKSGYQTDDLGHNLQWEAPAMIAADINSFIASSKPTSDAVWVKSAKDTSLVVTKGKATVICS